MKNFGIGHSSLINNKSKTNKHKRNSQLWLNSFAKHQLSHGGELRKKRKGRSQRPLSCKEPLHVVFKVNKSYLRHNSLRSNSSFRLAQKIIQHYAKKFFIKIEQISIQNDHIHLLIRTTRRSLFHYFFRVVAGQIAQRFQKEGLLKSSRSQMSSNQVTDTHLKKLKPGSLLLKLWKNRPFSRVVKGYKAYQIVRSYIQLNEKEVLKIIPYRKLRLKGLSTADWQILWR